jgi:hypothetical protein
MGRPIFESKADHASEFEIAAVLEEEWGVKLVKLAPNYSLDFAVYQTFNPQNPDDWPQDLLGFVECKDRSARFSWRDVTRNGFYRISLKKYLAGAAMCKPLELPMWLAIRCRDGLYVVRLRPDRDPVPRVAHGGRTDRKVWNAATKRLEADPADTEPMVEIPADRFILVD